MEYIFFFLEFILIAIGGVSLYTYLEIIEEHDHSENAKQISLVNIILPFGLFLITVFLYFYKTLSLDRLVILTLFGCIISAFISFAVYYLLWKENEDYSYDSNKTLREANEVTYIISVFLIIFIIGIMIGYGNSEAKITDTTQKGMVEKPINLVKLNTGKPKPPQPLPVAKAMPKPVMTSNNDDLMDDFIGKDPTIQKVIIL